MPKEKKSNDVEDIRPGVVRLILGQQRDWSNRGKISIERFVRSNNEISIRALVTSNAINIVVVHPSVVGESRPSPTIKWIRSVDNNKSTQRRTMSLRTLTKRGLATATATATAVKTPATKTPSTTVSTKWSDLPLSRSHPQMTGAEMAALCKQHTLYTWTAGNAIQPLPVVRAEGCYMYAADGQKILDFNAQLMSVNIGHGEPRVKEAMKRQIDELLFVNPQVIRTQLGASPGGRWSSWFLRIHWRMTSKSQIDHYPFVFILFVASDASSRTRQRARRLLRTEIPHRSNRPTVTNSLSFSFLFIFYYFLGILPCRVASRRVASGLLNVSLDGGRPGSLFRFPFFDL